MAEKNPDKGNPDILTEEQQAARDAGIDAAPPEAPEEPAKGELADTVLHEGTEYPAGTKASELGLDKDQRARLKRLGLIED